MYSVLSEASASESHGGEFDPGEIGRRGGVVENAGARTNESSKRVILKKGIKRRSCIGGGRRLSRELVREEKEKHLETTENPHCWFDLWRLKKKNSPGRVQSGETRISKESPSRLRVWRRVQERDKNWNFGVEN